MLTVLLGVKPESDAVMPNRATWQGRLTETAAARASAADAPTDRTATPSATRRVSGRDTVIS
jgi:hypothetical protein